jgi:hypothetical protein
MAKAAAKPTRTWISWRQALELVAKTFLSIQYAEQWLLEQLAADGIEWRVRAIDPPGHPLEGFWRGQVTVNSADNSVSSFVAYASKAGPSLALVPVILYGLELVREDVEARLPRAGKELAPKEWMANEVKLYPPPKGRGIVAWAKARARHMKDDLGEEKAWSWETIKRRFYDK